jgi:hypothetical protein
MITGSIFSSPVILYPLKTQSNYSKLLKSDKKVNRSWNKIQYLYCFDYLIIY